VTEYAARFLVVATGENSEGIIPNIPGLHDFPGEVTHSSNYKSWNNYAGKGVLVVVTTWKNYTRQTRLFFYSGCNHMTERLVDFMFFVLLQNHHIFY
jgi:hypothetical protein